VEIAERIFHRFEMTDVPREIEHVSATAHQPAHQPKVRGIAFDNFDASLDGLDIEVIGAASRGKVVNDCHRRAKVHETKSDIAPDEAEASGD